MKAVAVLVGLWCSMVGTTLACTVDCPEGYLGVCVERDGRCYCACAKDVSSGEGQLSDLLQRAGASEEGTARAVRRFHQFVESGATEFSFELEDDGAYFTVFVRRDNQEGGVERPTARP